MTPELGEQEIRGGGENIYEQAQENEQEVKELSLYDHISDGDIKTEVDREANYHVGMVYDPRTAIGLIAL